MSSHSPTGRVTGVSLASLVNTDVDTMFMYEKELVVDKDVTIAAQLDVDVNDELFAQLTALETDLNL